MRDSETLSTPESPEVTLSPEERLLLICLRSERDRKAVQQSDGILSLDLNWTLLTEMARGGDLAPHLHHDLRRTGRDGVPPDVMNRLQQLYLGSTGRSTIIRHELEEVLTALRDAKLDVIVLKGAALAGTVYRDPALRPMCNVDLLVRKEDIEKACRVLLGIGCRSGSCLSLEAQQRREHHLAMLRRPGGLGIEVHWTLAPLHTPFEPDLNGLWDRAQPACVADVLVLTLPAEDTLLHVSVHSASDVPYARRSNKLPRDLCDLDRIVWD